MMNENSVTCQVSLYFQIDYFLMFFQNEIYAGGFISDSLILLKSVNQITF